jgi:hypothetical protein
MRRRGAGGLGLGETTRIGVGCGGGAAKLSRSSGEKRDGGGTSVTTSSMARGSIGGACGGGGGLGEDLQQLARWLARLGGVNGLFSFLGFR